MGESTSRLDRGRLEVGELHGASADAGSSHVD